MPRIKLAYQIVKRNSQFVARFEDESFFGVFYLTHAELCERIANLQRQHVQCDVELDALRELERIEEPT